MKYDIFVSYRRSDRELVAQIVRKLETAGVGVWYDADLSGGEDFTDEIVSALQESEMLVIFFSEACNSSKHLKRELLVADKMSKPVVPILIEDTEPKGGYLYLLSDRNWVQAFPDPASRIDEVVGHLTTLAKKTGGLAGAAPAPKRAEAPAPAAPAPVEQQAPSAKDAVSDLPPLFGEGAPVAKSRTHAPVSAKDYVGRSSALGADKSRQNDILPFKWIDLVLLVPAIGALLYWMMSGMSLDSDAERVIAASIFVFAGLALYGALVFPFRYYLRRRPVMHAFRSYVASSLILFGLAMGPFLIAKSMFNMFKYDEPVTMLVGFGSAWLAFAVLAFLIYGVLAGQRALRSFRSNIKKIA